MERRDFLTTSLAASAFALSNPAPGQTQPQSSGGKTREYYEIRKYHMQSGPQTKLTESYVENALILETLATAELKLAQDATFMKAAEPFWNAPATAPAYQRVESSLLVAFEGWPKLTPPASAKTKAKRIFQLRTYESPSSQDHVRKVEMFHHGEFEIFQSAGFGQVFYGDTLIGPRMPNLTYMLTFPDMAALNACWDVFRNDPAWKKLSGSPRYAFEAIVSNISNLILSPTSYSQI
jgi:hypothetical protein